MQSVILKNISELRSYTRPINEEPVLIVETLGYSVITDAGGIRWVYDKSDNTNDDNYPFVVVGADGARWKPLKLEHITPEMFGAIGDGKTDDQVALQAAIDTAKSAWKRTDGTDWRTSSVWTRDGIPHSIPFRFYGRFAIGKPLVINENIIIEADVTLVSLTSFEGEQLLRLEKQVHIIGKISFLNVDKKNSPRSAVTARFLGLSTLPDIFIDGFSGYAIDVDGYLYEEDGQYHAWGHNLCDKKNTKKNKGNNNNSVSVGRVVATRCGESKSSLFTKISDDVGSDGSIIQRSFISLVEYAPPDLELFIYNDKIYKVMCREGNTFEVFPKISDDNAEIKYFSGGVLRLGPHNDSNVWDIQALQGIGCPGILFASRSLYGSTIHNFLAEGCGVGVVWGTATSGSCLHSTIFRPYVENVEIPFLIEATNTSVTIIEPMDETSKQGQYPTYRKLLFADYGYSVIRNGEFSGYPVREVLSTWNHDLVVQSGQRIWIKKGEDIKLGIKIARPTTASSQIEIILDGFDGGEHLKFSAPKSDKINGYSYTVEGELSYTFHVPLPPLVPDSSESGEVFMIKRHKLTLVLAGTDFRFC